MISQPCKCRKHAVNPACPRHSSGPLKLPDDQVMTRENTPWILRTLFRRGRR